MSFYHAMDTASRLFSSLGDTAYATQCNTTKQSIRDKLDLHWTGTFMTESSNRLLDGAVIHAFSSFTAYPITDSKIAMTIRALAFSFCNEYPINQKDDLNGIPGILIGRYPGDIYVGGNPWQLLTAVTAKAFYQGATALSLGNGFGKEEDRLEWAQLLNISPRAGIREFAKGMMSAGDAVMYRLYQHVKNKNGHVDEQIDKNTGEQVSAKDLTWSYANVLSAMQQRKYAVTLLQHF
jgi:glucoamylase